MNIETRPEGLINTLINTHTDYRGIL